ncbi:YfhO family protein [Sporolactobacillus sp. CQH2019]|uniref:YfhO family protein n=1 Tax=Sporolactobacillus sp. CQH2019 TaxID=3023512 RepID=UPI00236829FB|nr:YfhO family protein [Sporolactobacillus sp. CQH2019]MDD9147965.1 YfhO family protein [Sporolactobacillus sp. CQH2019]
MAVSVLKKTFQSDYTKVFLLCLLTSGLMFLPSIIINKGLFTLVGDFNYQQIPFNMLSNSSIKHGDIFWSWATDLGSNFIGSYSFYTLGSPFFWLSLLFPASFFPYIIGPMLMLKYCVAGMTAFGYMKRYVSDKHYAAMGALLYAFSGFSVVNLMFNHFQDVIAFFPLLLAGMDKLVEDRKHGWFAAAVALNATLNFFFFMGELVFLILYFCIRFLAEDIRKYIRALPKCLLEGAVGLGMACFLFLPAVLFTVQNPRLNAFLYGPSALTFDGARYLEIIKAFLMPADLMPYQSAIYDSDFTSSGAYLPLFGPVLVIAMMIGERKNWMSRITLLSLIMACIPLLNSLFYVLNASYYARWFYMPVLIMALMSAVVLEKRNEISIRSIRKGWLITAGATALLAVFLFFYPWSPSEKSAVFRPDLFLFYLSVTLAGLAGTYYLIGRFKSTKYWTLVTTAVLVLFSGGLGLFNIEVTNSVYSYQSGSDIYNTLIKTARFLNAVLPKSEDYRVGISDDGSNLPMVSNTPTVNSFTSMVNGSIFNFYRSLDDPREVKTIIPDSYFGLQPLLSERFYIDTVQDKNGYLYAQFNNGTNTVYVYENKNVLPIGFTYDYYMTTKQFNMIPAEDRHLALLKAVVLSPSEVSRVKNFLLPIPISQLNSIESGNYLQDVRARASEASTYFHRDQHGFTSKIRTDSEKYAFFSVPYDQGWSATVNGQPVQILNTDGFMIVPVNEGNNTIRFTYQTPGLTAGIFISLLSLVLWAGWIYGGKKFSERLSNPFGKTPPGRTLS